MAALSLMIYCHSDTESEKKTEATLVEGEYLNWNDSVRYVGSEACATCHQEIYKSFKQTGMGESFHFATRQKSAATYTEHTVIEDTINNFMYHPFWKNDSLYVREFRLEGKDTIHQRALHIKYIVGSGQHTNSHIIDDNGYLKQAPITFYTQKGIWDLAPGFDSNLANRLNRIIGKECMTCHNSYPEFVEGSENKFTSVPLGIGCERCHGPGEEHIKRKVSGEIIDTAKYIDYSIVNPGKLSKELQMSVCQRCHAQGVAILKEGKDFTDFKPGKHIKEVMDVFLPKYDGYQTLFIMASHADRTAMSQCYQKSEMTCISCHNPHVSVKQTPREKFNAACVNCHKDVATQVLCSLGENERAKEQNDCSKCHMPESGSIDIPYVTIHDHYIRKPIPESEKGKIENFIGLQNITNPESKDPLIRARAYIRYYEAFQSESRMLDSTAFYLKQVNSFDSKAEDLVHLHFLRNDYRKIRKIAPKMSIEQIKEPWTLYRIGEAYLEDGDHRTAENYFTQAVERKPFNLDFQNKLGSAKMQLKKVEEAAKIFEFIVKEDDQHLAALNNWGFALFNLSQFDKAGALYEKAIAINPDYIPALLNQLGLAYYRQDLKEGRRLLEKVLKIDPTNEKALLIKKRGLL